MTRLVPALLRAEGVVLDTDGVIVDSAGVHAEAWKCAFDGYLERHPPDDPHRARPFSVREDYLDHVDGRSRLDGAAAFLASRGLRPDDSGVREVAAAKERIFAERLRTRAIPAFPGTVRLLRALRAHGTPCGAASASRHARELLANAGVLACFDVLVDGAEAARLGLPGKPDPALFTETARRLGTPPARTALVEDALAGVEAGRRGGFAPVIAVDRGAGRGRTAGLLAHGADLVVGDPAELTEDRARG